MPIVRTGALPSHLIVGPDPFILPRYWSTIWTLYVGKGWAESTLSQRLYHIDRLYLYCDKTFGYQSLDEAFGSKNAERLHVILDGFYILLTSKVQVSSTDVQCWDAVSSFFRYFAEQWAVSNSQWRFFLKAIPKSGAIRQPTKGKVSFTRALPNSSVAELLAIAMPGTKNNPFTTSTVQVRNWLLILLMLLGGLRRGEALLLTLESVKQDLDTQSGEIRYWLDVTETVEDESLYDDTRATRPSIKTTASHRQVPISEELAHLIERYISEFRIDSEKHQFLITSRTGQPLSAESITKSLRILSLAMEPEALKAFRQKTKKHIISPHNLRHTCACIRYVMFLSDGDKERAMGRMRAFFGWSIDSTMPDRYARAAIEDDVKNSVSKTFDAMLSIYREK